MSYRHFFLFEWRRFITSKKTIGIYTILMLLGVFYALQLYPKEQSLEPIEPLALENHYITTKNWLEQVNPETLSDPHLATWLSYILDQLDIEERRISAWQQADYPSYAESSAEWYGFMVSRTPYFPARYYRFGSLYAAHEGVHNYLRMQHLLQAFATYGQSKNLTPAILEEKTAWQTVAQQLKTSLPLLLFASAILLNNDLLTKDKRHQTLFATFPLTPFRYSLLKGVVGWLGACLSLLCFIPAFLMIGFQQGFGQVSLPYVLFQFQTGSGWILNYQVVTLYVYLGQCLLLILLSFALWIGLCLIVAKLFTKEFVPIGLLGALGLSLAYFERGHYQPEWSFWLPTSFVQVGKIVTGDLQFRLLTTQLTFKQAVSVLSVSCLIALIILWGICQVKKESRG